MTGFTISNIIEVLFFLTAVLAGYVKLQTKIKELEMRIISMEHNFALREVRDEKVIEKLDSISEQISEVKVQLANKQNRA